MYNVGMSSLSEGIRRIQANQRGEREKQALGRQQIHDNTTRLAELEDQRKQGKIGELFDLLDSFGAREQLEELRRDVWGGVGTIITHSSINSEIFTTDNHGRVRVHKLSPGWNESNPVQAQYILSFNYFDVQESLGASVGAPSMVFGIPFGSGGGSGSKWVSKFVEHKHSISISTSEDQPNIVVRGYKNQPRGVAVSHDDPTIKSFKKVIAPANSSEESSSVLKQELAEACVELEWAKQFYPPLSESKKGADRRLRKHGWDDETGIQKVEKALASVSHDETQEINVTLATMIEALMGENAILSFRWSPDHFQPSPYKGLPPLYARIGVRLKETEDPGYHPKRFYGISIARFFAFAGIPLIELRRVFATDEYGQFTGSYTGGFESTGVQELANILGKRVEVSNDGYGTLIYSPRKTATGRR